MGLVGRKGLLLALYNMVGTLSFLKADTDIHFRVRTLPHSLATTLSYSYPILHPKITAKNRQLLQPVVHLFDRFVSLRQELLIHVLKHKEEFNVILKSIMGPGISSASGLRSVNDAVGLGQICRYQIQGHRRASILLWGAECPQHSSSAQAAAKTYYLHGLVSLRTASLSCRICP